MNGTDEKKPHVEKKKLIELDQIRSDETDDSESDKDLRVSRNGMLIEARLI